MTAHVNLRKLSPLEYLEFEREAPDKHEYYDGVIVAMSGCTPEHDYVNVNIIASLHTQLIGKACTPCSGNMRVSVPECNCYFYPDASVACEEPQYERIAGVQSLTNPTLVVEITSESTEKRDRQYKLICYQSVPSLMTYVIVSQDQPLIQVYERQPDSTWSYTHYLGLDSVVPVPSIGCTLKLADVYACVEFPEENDCVLNPLVPIHAARA